MRIAQGISVTNLSKPISTAIVYDADAVAFFTAASITDTTQKSAVNQLVLDLKAASIWAKMKALYPVVGGVASSHAVNLKTPGTYNLTFATGWTHASTGMTPNGATYADTSLVPNGVLTNYNYHFAFYSRTQSISTGAQGRVDIGSQSSASQTSLLGIHSYGYSYFTAGNNSTTVAILNPGISDTRGFAIGSITANNLIKLYFDNTVIATNTTLNTNSLSTLNTWIGANSLSGGSEYSNKECAFASIGDGLTDAEASSFYTAVQTYQTTLGRQV